MSFGLASLQLSRRSSRDDHDSSIAADCVLAQSVAPSPPPSAIFISVDSRLDSVRLTSPAAGVSFDIDGDGDPSEERQRRREYFEVVLKTW